METVLHVARLALEHKKVIDENERYRAHLEAIFRSVDDGILTVDEELKVLEMNDAFCRICGLDRDGIGGKLGDSFMGCGNEFLKALQEAVEEKRSVKMERVECTDSSQAPRILTLSAAPLMDRQGHISGAVMVVRG
jgi:PAS domain S-box-containing protein